MYTLRTSFSPEFCSKCFKATNLFHQNFVLCALYTLRTSFSLEILWCTRYVDLSHKNSGNYLSLQQYLKTTSVYTLRRSFSQEFWQLPFRSNFPSAALVYTLRRSLSREFRQMEQIHTQNRQKKALYSKWAYNRVTNLSTHNCLPTFGRSHTWHAHTGASWS